MGFVKHSDRAMTVRTGEVKHRLLPESKQLQARKLASEVSPATPCGSATPPAESAHLYNSREHAKQLDQA